MLYRRLRFVRVLSVLVALGFHLVLALSPLCSQVFERVNLTDGGAQDPGSQFAVSPAARGISADGRFVLFLTPGNLCSTIDTNTTSGHDVYVRDRVSGETILISSSASTPPVLPHAYLSANGSFVAFQDRIGPAAPGAIGLFGRAVSGGSQRRIDIGPEGQESQAAGRFPRLSADGFVLFFNAAFFIPGLGFQTGIWRRDLAAGETVAFETRSGIAASAGPEHCSISDDGSVVAFLFGGGIQIKGAPGDTPELVVPGLVGNPELSGDGRFLAFFDTRGQLRERGLYIVDLATDREPRLVRAMSLGALPGVFTPTLSQSGRFLGFQTREGIDPRDTNGLVDTYVWDREEDTFLLLSAGATGAIGNQDAAEVYVSGNGQTAALTSMADNLVPGDTNQTSDVFVASLGILAVNFIGPTQVPVAERSTHAVAVRNLGPETVKDISLEVARQGVALAIFSDPAVPTQGSCSTEENRLLCQIGDLGPGEVAVVSFSLLSLGVETVSYLASATGTLNGDEIQSNESALTVRFDRCSVNSVGPDTARFGESVDVLFFFDGPGEGEVEFEVTVEEPGGILERLRLSDEELIVSVTAIERPGEVTVTARATRGGCTATTTHTITFLAPILRAVPERRADAPQEPVNDDRDADAVQKVPPCSIMLQSGENRHDRTDLVIPGRGDIHFVFRRRYRSQIRFDGPLGHNWDFNYNEGLVEGEDGDVVRVNGQSHVDVWRRNQDGSYTAPRGFFSTLLKEDDGTFVLRQPDGLKRFYDAQGRLAAREDRTGNRMTFDYDADGNLDFVTDTYGRRIDFVFEDGRLARIRDFFDREVIYSYDENGNLVSVRTPVVAGTSTGNDFPEGRIETYAYSSGFEEEDLNHNLLAITYAEETAVGGPPALNWTYGIDPTDPLTFDRVLTQTEGGTNVSGVPAGGTSTFVYEALNPQAPPGDLALPRLRTTVTDRKGNVSEFFFNERSQHILTRDLTRGLREGEPEAFETRYEYDEDDQLVHVVLPEGNEIRYVYDRQGPRGAQRNVIEIRHIADPMRGGGEDLVTTMSYEPLYNRLQSVTDPRGNAVDFVPPIGVASGERYTRRFFYDYQEGNGEIAEAERFELDLTGAPRDLGDLNGDGRTDQVAGNRIRTVAPQVSLPPGAKEAERLGSQTQEIVVESQWNDHGQRLARIDPEGNVLTLAYYAADDPDGDGLLVPEPTGTDASGYLRLVTVDASESPRRLSTSPPTALQTNFRYDPVGNITRVENPRGVVTEIEVNALNEPVQFTRGAEIADAVASGELLTAEAPFRYRRRIFYDHNGRPVRFEVENRDSTTEGVGEFVESTVTYDILDNPVRSTVEVDASTTLVYEYRWDENELLSEVIQPEGNRLAMTYDERDLLFTATRGAGSAEESTIRYDFDRNGNLSRVLDAEDNDGDGEPEATVRLYDGFDRLVAAIDAIGNETRLEYDPASNVLRRRVLGHPAGNPGALNVLLEDTLFAHDEIKRIFRVDRALFLAAGFRPTRAVDLQDGNSDGLVTTLLEYDALSRPTFLIEDDGEVAQVVYDGASRPVEFVDDAGNRRLVAYDQNSNVVEVTSIELSPESLVPEERFVTLYIYDQLDRLVRLTDNVGQTTRFGYDSRDNLTTRSDPEGALMTVDPLGLFLGDINAAGNTRTWFYDGLDRNVLQVSDLRVGGQGGNPLDLANPHNPDGQVILRYEFDGNSRLTGIVDDNQNRTSFGYDALNRRTRQTNADGETHTYAYDRDHNLIERVDPNGSVVTNTYDVLDRVVRRDVARAAGVGGTTTETYGYDGLSRLTLASDDNDGSATVHSVERVYDSLSRVWEERQIGFVSRPERTAFIRGDCNSDGDTGGVTDVVFLLSYNFLGTEEPPCQTACDTNGDGDIGGVTDAIALLAFNFLGGLAPVAPFPGCGVVESAKLSCESHPPCAGGEAASVGVLSTVWSGDSKRLSCTYPGGRTVRNAFDPIDRVKTTSDATGEIAERFWIGSGYRELRRLCGNGTSLSVLDDSGDSDIGYDGIKRLVHQRCFLPDGTTAFLDRQYTFNRASVRTSETRTDDFGLTDRYAYDSLYRLRATEFDRDGLGGATRRAVDQVTYVLDGVGNRREVETQRTTGPVNLAYTANEMNEYTQIGAASWTYDSNGNLTDDGTRTFTYDYKNRLRRVADKASGAPIAEYLYYPDNRRARKTTFDASGAGEVEKETLFFYDGWGVCEEVDGQTGQTELTYVWSPGYIDELVQGERTESHPLGPGVFYAHQNARADVAALTDASGAVSEKIVYDDFGNPTAPSAVGNPYLFQGRRLDRETGFYYYRNRYYDPASGRFLQRDPVWDEGNVGNQYTFVGNGPASGLDPSGLEGEDGWIFNARGELEVYGVDTLAWLWGHEYNPLSYNPLIYNLNALAWYNQAKSKQATYLDLKSVHDITIEAGDTPGQAAALTLQVGVLEKTGLANLHRAYTGEEYLYHTGRRDRPCLTGVERVKAGVTGTVEVVGTVATVLAAKDVGGSFLRGRRPPVRSGDTGRFTSEDLANARGKGPIDLADDELDAAIRRAIREAEAAERAAARRAKIREEREALKDFLQDKPVYVPEPAPHPQPPSPSFLKEFEHIDELLPNPSR